MKPVYPAADHISNQDNTPKDPKPVSQACISKSEGHENGQKNPECWKANDITQEANHQGANWDQHENAKSSLKLFWEAKQRPAVEPSI